MSEGRQDQSSGGLLRSSALISVGVLVSRLTGLLRTGVLIAVLGTSSLASVYNFANNVPNILYELVAGGVLSAVLLPVFVDQLTRRDREATSAVVSAAVIGLAALTLAGVATAPALAAAIAKLSNRADQQTALTLLLRWFVPQVFFYGLMTLATSLLQARRRFGAAAFAPALNNGVTIVAYVVAAFVAGTDLHDPHTPLQAVVADRWALTVLGLGTTLGVVANAAVLLPALRREQLALRPTLALRHPAIGQLGRAARGALGYVGVTQVAVIITSLLANRYGPAGGFAAYSYANLFFFFAFGLLAVSVTTALAPELSAAAQAGDVGRVRREWLRGLRLIMLLMAPASALLVALARPLMGSIPLLDDADLTAGILAWFCVGLAAFSMFSFVVRSFYALSDTRAPFRLALVQNGVVVAAGLALSPLFGIRGLAAAYAIGFLVSAVVAFATFARRIGRVPIGQVRPVVAMLGAAIAAATVAAAAVAVLRWGGRSVPDPVQAALGLAVAGAAYPAYLWAVRADDDLRAAVALLRRMTGR